MTQVIQKTLRDSAAMRWTALLLLAMAMFCSYIFMDILSPIKDLMQETRGWDSTAFGTMQGSEVFLNVFVFFLIFAGIILDKMGVRFTALVHREPELYSRLRRAGRFTFLRGHACFGQVCSLRIHDLRLWM